MTFFFETYGCQMNQAESSSVERLLVERGWVEAPTADESDLVVINTCSVRATAETRALSRISHFHAQKKRRKLAVVVMGCMAERIRDGLEARFPRLDRVVGMFERGTFEGIFRAIEEGADLGHAEEPASGGYLFAASSYREGTFQSYVPIMNGCDNFCSYCIVPYVRGREVSRPLADILDEFDVLAENGVREVTLLGQNVNSWRYVVRPGDAIPELDALPGGRPVAGSTLSFPDLVTLIARRVATAQRIATAQRLATVGWIRFMSSHPKDLSDALIAALAREPVFCRLVHLPVQHGSNRILEGMNRRYTREDYLSLVSRVRSGIPGVALSTDILVGFPGETEEDLEETLSLMREVGFHSAYMYHYNPREGTKAASLPNRIADEVKKERLARVIKLQHSITASRMRARVGSVATVLVESVSRNDPDELLGHTELGEMVVFGREVDRSAVGNFVEAELVSLRGRTFRARIVG